MRTRRSWRVVLSLGAPAVMYACLPTEPCACPPARTHAALFGTVSSGAGVPLQHARVQAVVYREECGRDHPEIDPDANPVLTNSAGDYELRFQSLHGPRTACVRVTAHRTTPALSDSVFVDTLLVLQNERTQPERIRVNLLFP